MRSIDHLLDIADSINDLVDENQRLRSELAHTQCLLEKYQEAEERSRQHSGEMFGIILGAVLDPESLINKGTAAIDELARRDKKAKG
jgi:hypothetical protein